MRIERLPIGGQGQMPESFPLRADPGLGFPPGTPADASTLSWHGMVHLIVGTVSFLSLIAACFVFARRFVA